MPIGSIFRLFRAGFVLAREGVFTQIDHRHLPAQARFLLGLARLIARDVRSDRRGAISKAMAKLGPSYIKLGQFLATRPDIVGVRAADELSELQDRLAPFPKSKAIKIIEVDLGVTIDQIFLEFSEPVAAASIAQVHKARVRDVSGERYVAVKVLRPGVERQFRRDVADMLRMARIAERFSQEARRLRIIEVVETLARSVKLEMDFRIEASAASEFAENTEADDTFRVPKVDWDRTSKNVLVIEWVNGTSLSDLEGLKKKGFDLPTLGKNVIQSFLRHAMRDGFFHADMHQGNLFIDETGVLTAVDFGITGRLGQKERRFLAEILYGFITRNYRRVADFAQAIRAIGEPIHSRTADQISMAKLLALLFEVTALFEMKTRTELVLLQKTMVVVEGVARSLDPRLNLWSAADPVVSDWVADNIGPGAILHDFGDSAWQFLKSLSKVNDLIEKELACRDLELQQNGAASRNTAVSLPLSVKLALWIGVTLLAINVVLGLK
jgi:ubiquinone biosynthesis protein